MKRSIAIFPIYAAEGKSQAQVVMYSVRRCFEAMLRRYPRNSKILEEITNDQAIDILLELRPASEQDDGGRSSPNIPVSTSGSSSAVVSSPVVTATSQNTDTQTSTVAPYTPQLAASRCVMLLHVEANYQALYSPGRLISWVCASRWTTTCEQNYFWRRFWHAGFTFKLSTLSSTVRL